MKSGTIKVLELLSDGEFHSNVELNKCAGWRFGDKLFMLRKYGCIFEKKQGEKYIEYWKLLSIPYGLEWRGRGTLKFATEYKKPVQQRIFEPTNEEIEEKYGHKQTFLQKFISLFM